MADGVAENAPSTAPKRTFPRSFGRYILEKSLSRGGMGEVFLAVAKSVYQRCVIKTIRGDLTGDEEFIGRFADEAKIMMRIDHENIIRVFDAGKVHSDYYIAMEYMHGRDLGDVLDRAYERGEPMPTQLGLYVAQKLLEGLDYAHRLTAEDGRPMGIVHRDISPQNVLVGFDGSIKLIDFGLARTDLLPARTQGALAVGKYGYMSPEQARHEKIDGRADIYSTGVMLFEVFTGDRLVDEQDQATLWSRVLNPKHRKPSVVVPSLPAEIDELVMTAVAVKADDRFRDAAQMRDFVKALRNSESNREELVRYLRFLYPKLDFSPPPVPDFGVELIQAEKSLIIATSRERALSVFGRGELPIEWTTQIDAAELQSVFSKLRRPIREGQRLFDREAKTEADIVDIPSPTRDPVDPTWIRGAQERAAQTNARRGVEQEAPTGEHRTVDSAGGPPSEPTMEARGAAPTPLPISAGQRVVLEAATHPEIAALGSSRVNANFRDDEMTVMMDAPPRPAATRAGDRHEVDTGDNSAEIPTTLSAAVIESDAEFRTVQSPIRAKPTADRVQREKEREDRTPPRDREKPQRAQLIRSPKMTVAHRSTVPSDVGPPAQRPDHGSGQRAAPTTKRGSELFPGVGWRSVTMIVGLLALIALLLFKLWLR